MNNEKIVTLKLRRKSETNEWVVVYYENGKRNEEKTYYTDSKADALLTMATIQSKIDQKAIGYC